jgi:hypothetical protein
MNSVHQQTNKVSPILPNTIARGKFTTGPARSFVRSPSHKNGRVEEQAVHTKKQRPVVCAIRRARACLCFWSTTMRTDCLSVLSMVDIIHFSSDVESEGRRCCGRCTDESAANRRSNKGIAHAPRRPLPPRCRRRFTTTSTRSMAKIMSHLFWAMGWIPMMRRAQLFEKKKTETNMRLPKKLLCHKSRERAQ